MTEWQPIETAPKDGTRVLLFVSFRGKEPVCGLWVGHPEGLNGYWTHDKLSKGNYKFKCSPDRLPQPTHWMPLPQAPAKKKSPQ